MPQKLRSTNFAALPTLGAFRLFAILGLLLSLFLPISRLEAAPLMAATDIQITSSSAKARYGVGLTFTVQARSTGGQLNQIELKLNYGKNSQEYPVKVQFTPGSTTEGRAEIGTEDAPLAAGMPISYYWLLGNSSGDRIRSETKMVVYEDTRFNWRQRSGPQVTVRWYNGDEDYGNLMYVLATDALATYKRRFSISPYEQIYISIYGSSRDYHQAAPDVPDWSGGYTLLERNEILAIAPQNSQASILIGEGIPHELSHAALYQHLGHRRAPTWLDEGLAVYNQNVIAPVYDTKLQLAYRQNNMMPLADLNLRFPSEEDPAELAYAEGRSMVTFLINNYGDATWANLLDQLRYGEIDQAMQKVFGVKLAAMEEQWRNSLGGKKPILPTALLTGPVSAVPPAPVAGLSNNRSAGGGFGFDMGKLITGGLTVLLIFSLVFGSLIFLRWRKNHRESQKWSYPARIEPYQAGNYPASALPYQPPYNVPPPSPYWNSLAVPPYQAAPALYQPPVPPSPAVSIPPSPYWNGPASSPYQPAPGPVNYRPVSPAQDPDDPDPFDIISATFGPPKKD